MRSTMTSSGTSISTTCSSRHARGLHRLGLRNGAREAVEEEAARAIGGLDALLHEADDDLVGDELAAIHDLLGREPERRAGLDRGAQHVAGGDLRDAVALRDERGLGALARSGTAQEESIASPLSASIWPARDYTELAPRPRSRSAAVSTPGLERLVPERDRDAMAVPQRAQLLERLEALGGRGRERRVLAQEARAVGVDADVADTRAGPRAARRASARTRRARTGSARGRSTARIRRYRARPSPRSDRRTRRPRRSGAPRWRSTALGRSASSPATLRISSGSMSGSSPCTFTTISSWRVAQQRRPPRRAGRCRSRASTEVVQTFQPSAATASAISWWSVAITTSSAPLAARARRPRPPAACRRCRRASCRAGASSACAPGSRP